MIMNRRKNTVNQHWNLARNRVASVVHLSFLKVCQGLVTENGNYPGIFVDPT